MKKILIIGIGNTGRSDDGLGWKFAEKSEELFRDGCDIEYRYQLQVEDAELISHYDTVIFADAIDNELQKGFSFVKCEPGSEYFFSSHIQSPEAILYLSKTVFGKSPEAFLLKLQGMEWGMKTQLSEVAEKNLKMATSFLKGRMENKTHHPVEVMNTDFSDS